jgi:hypothetical protein
MGARRQRGGHGVIPFARVISQHVVFRARASTNLPHEAPEALVDAIIDVDGLAR